MRKSAVVFAYHNVGVRCLQVLLSSDIEIKLVVTHEIDPNETIWFESVAELASEHHIPTITPKDPHAPEFFKHIQTLAPDLIFSFYYRHMLPINLLNIAKEGAFNMHGSLLPKFRGRVPINWAIIKGETETGATLHEMTAKPDAGAIIAQTKVPILPDDIALQVFNKVTVAAEQTLWAALPSIIAGNVKRRPNDIGAGSYYGGRKPEDGRIAWSQPGKDVYNLIRALAPPYPGAFTEFDGKRCIIARARLLPNKSYPGLSPGLHLIDEAFVGICGDRDVILVKELLWPL